MKKIIFTAIITVAALSVNAQTTDTLSLKKDTVKKHGYHIFFDKRKSDKAVTSSNKDTIEVKEHSKAAGFSFGITFSRFDLGLATLVDNGSFKLSPQNNFLRYRSWKTSNVGFDLVQVGYRFTSGFKIYASGGFDWTLIRLRENITIQKNAPVLTYTNDNIDYSKNRFSSSYLRIPLTFDFRSHEDASGKSFHFAAGPDIGILLNGRVKQISDENGKQKINDDYHFAKLRYGTFARIGYGFFGVFGKYYFNDMFENSPAQKGLKNFSFGIMAGF